jgi:hypothetical protein
MTAPEAMDKAVKLIEAHFGTLDFPEELGTLLELVAADLRAHPLTDRQAAERIRRQAGWAFDAALTYRVELFAVLEALEG